MYAVNNDKKIALGNNKNGNKIRKQYDILKQKANNPKRAKELFKVE